MENEQKQEWVNAQNITFRVDLVNAAKKLLKFLAVVDHHQHDLFAGSALQRAIFRYNAFWIPLLAKHLENPLLEEPLVVPLDCEWIWYCHRLNPIRYKLDCEKKFGRILDNNNVISSVQGIPHGKTEKIWNTMYPKEPYELTLNRKSCKDEYPENTYYEIFTNYDLVSANARQISSSAKISGACMSNDQFLLQAVARYKGFIHLIKTNKMKNIRQFSVPTLDIDLIWHSHQLHPASYCDDLKRIVGEVKGHDDSVTKGKKLDTGFFEITKQWEDTFGLSYKKMRVMYEEDTPTPSPFSSTPKGKRQEYNASCVASFCGGHSSVKGEKGHNASCIASFCEGHSSAKGEKGHCVASFCGGHSSEKGEKGHNASCVASFCGGHCSAKGKKGQNASCVASFCGGHSSAKGEKGHNASCVASFCGGHSLAKGEKGDNASCVASFCGGHSSAKSEEGNNASCAAGFWGGYSAIKSEENNGGCDNINFGNGFELKGAMCATSCVASSMVNKPIAA